MTAAYNDITNINQKSFFIVKKDVNNKLNVLPLSAVINLTNRYDNVPNYEELYFAFADPSKSESYPGWPMRNYMVFLLYCW